MTVEQPINPPVPAQAIRAEIQRVREHLLFASGDYEVYLLRSADAPSLMQELYRQGKTIIFVTHNPELATFSSRNITLKDGMIIEDTSNPKIASASEILANLPKPE